MLPPQRSGSAADEDRRQVDGAVGDRGGEVGQAQVLRGTGAGKTNKKVVRHLGLSEDTAKSFQ
ncbi:hypothetical protein [Amycolatopsis sp. WQ 127309]|uniref:hypothetical protein n=1 Tax=Amycolatopsis sp. WQ 127309 TaxID=2932773 RepID=UPI001FF42548|nr:hypothetical protein [Amycolatopsis sp. WQ 127309]UOZ05512.1 hypothetical protein MUY22_42900 [Amycolatopsis sp. WQ 127309]